MFLTEAVKNRGFQYAIAISVLWHLFWFFAITIDIKAPASKHRPDLKVYFLGPVLSDDAFNMIVALKPELSETSYRAPEDFSQNLEPEMGTLERLSPGDLVSVPLGRATWGALRGVIKAEKPYADTEFYQKFSIDIVKSPFPIQGDLKRRDILYLPELPEEPLALNLEEPALIPEAEFELTVSDSGEVTRVENIISSGQPEVDLTWQRYLKKWQFMPQERKAKKGPQKGIVRVTFNPKSQQ